MVLSRTPALGQLRPVRRGYGFRGPILGQTFDGTLGVAHYVGDVLRLGAHGLTAYLGFHVGTKEKGWLSVLGWTVGLLQGMGAFIDVLTLVANIQESRRAAQERPEEQFVPFDSRN